MNPEHYLVRLTASAEAAFLRLPLSLRQSVRDVMEGLSEIASYLPPVDPKWLKLPGQKPPVLRVSVQGHEVVYTVDAASRTIAIWGVEAEEPQAQLAC